MTGGEKEHSIQNKQMAQAALKDGVGYKAKAVDTIRQIWAQKQTLPSASKCPDHSDPSILPE